MTVAFVVIEIRERPLKLARRTVSAAKLRQFEIGAAIQLLRPADVIADEQVKLAVIVIIDPRSAGAPAVRRSPYSCYFSDLAKFAVAFVVEQVIAADARHEKVGQSVVIVITHGNAHAVHGNIQS